MYPDFHYLFKFLFGIDIPAISFIKTFGFFVAMGFLGGALVLSAELKRKARLGILTPTIRKTRVGEKTKTKDWLPTAVTGFLIGFKLIGLILSQEEAAADPMSYIFSTKGHLLGGLVLAVFLGYSRYREKKKQELTNPKTVEEKVFPHHRVMDIIFIAAVAGFLGAKIFNAFESWDHFIQDPLGNLLSSGGFTFYGGLITATAALYLYARRHKISFRQLCDAAAPALMIAYAIGRLGCHFSGDGDWGVYNSAYISNADGTLTEQVDDRAFIQLTQDQPELFSEFNKFESVPHIFQPALSGLPRWMVAMNYAHNVNREGITIEGFDGHYNKALPAAVFPTSIYEFFACTLLFLILMGVRRKFTVPLGLFGLYLVLNGLERFFIEKIRVNYKYDWGIFYTAQAEIISVALILAGIIILIYTSRKKPTTI